MKSMDMAIDNEVYIDDVYTGEMMMQDDIYMETENNGISSNVILWITIIICAILGIVLGIILGRRSAMK